MLFCVAADTHIKKGLIAQERDKPALAQERDKPAVRKARLDWARRQKVMQDQPHRLIFIDETGTDTNMTRAYGRCPKGLRLKGTAPFRRWGNQTLIAGLSCEGIVAPWVISGAMDRDAFETYVEKVLVPELERGSVVTLDNLATHRSDKAARLLKAHGCWFLFLPAYSPNLNPIEMAFSKLKAHLRRIGARTFDQLIAAIGDVCGLFTPVECWNFFKAAGYAS
jgi:transposase